MCLNLVAHSTALIGTFCYKSQSQAASFTSDLHNIWEEKHMHFVSLKSATASCDYYVFCLSECLIFPGAAVQGNFFHFLKILYMQA